MNIKRQLKELNRQVDREDVIKRKARPLTRLEAIRAFYVKGLELSREHEEHRQLLETINSLLCQRYTPVQVIKLIKRFDRFKDRFKRAPGEATKAYQDAVELYGDIARTSRAGLTAILTERQLRLAAKAEELGDFELSSKMLDRVAKMNGLPEETSNLKRRRRISVSYSTDPQFLKQKEEILEEIYE